MIKTNIISYSEISKFQTCPRQYWYKFILDRTPIKESDTISTGINGHKLLQKFYTYLQEGFIKEEAWAKVTSWASSEISLDGSLLKAWVLVDNYIRETDFTAKAVLVENRFLFPAHKLLDVVDTVDFRQAVRMIGMEPQEAYDIIDKLHVGFTPDLVIERTGNFLDVEDYKFIQRKWFEAKTVHFPQLKLYKVFLNQMGYGISKCVLRFFNVTTGESPRTNFQDYIPRKEEEAILIRDFLIVALEVYRFKNLPADIQKLVPKTMNYTACQFCSYSFVCSLQAEGKDASKTLDVEYVGSNYDYTK